MSFGKRTKKPVQRTQRSTCTTLVLTSVGCDTLSAHKHNFSLCCCVDVLNSDVDAFSLRGGGVRGVAATPLGLCEGEGRQQQHSGRFVFKSFRFSRYHQLSFANLHV